MWDESFPFPQPHFGGSNHKEEFYRGLMKCHICSLKALIENVFFNRFLDQKFEKSTVTFVI